MLHNPIFASINMAIEYCKSRHKNIFLNDSQIEERKNFLSPACSDFLWQYSPTIHRRDA